MGYRFRDLSMDGGHTGFEPPDGYWLYSCTFLASLNGNQQSDEVIGSFHDRICAKPAIRLSRKDWNSLGNGAVVSPTRAERRASESSPAGCFARAGLRWCGGWRRIDLQRIP